MGKKKFLIIGAIYLGTNNLKLTVAQVDKNGEFIILEELVRPTMLGSDAFSRGRIAVSTMHETLVSLKGFNQLLKEYGVKTYRAISASAFREADNREYILEHIRMDTGIDVKVINSAQERYFMYKALRYQTPWLGLSKESFLVVNISSGGVELSIYEQGSLKLMEYINIGSLRLYEMLSGLKNINTEFSRIMEDFVYSRLSFLVPLIKKENIKYLVGLGSDINIFSRLCGQNEDQSVHSKDIAAIYNKVKKMPGEELREIYGLSLQQAEMLLPTVIILNSIFTVTNTKRIFIPGIELQHGIIYDLADSLYHNPKQKDYDKDIISSVWYIANKYGLEKEHSASVSKMALAMFDQTATLHHLGIRERQYLQIAAILHTIGYFVNYSEQYQLSYELVRKQNIMGFTEDELDIIANIVFYHGSEIPRRHHEHYQKLSCENKMTVSKLAAILKMADSVSISRSDKIKALDVVRQGEVVNFIMHTEEQVPLEEWAFTKHAQFFEEVFGLRPKLRYKG